MSSWKKVSDFVKFSTKGITPHYVVKSQIIVLNQKCIRDNRIDFTLAQFSDENKISPNSKYLQVGDILINSTGTGTAGRSAFVSELPAGYKVITDSHILLLRCYSYLEAQCLSFNLFSFEKRLMSFMTGSSGQSELDKVVLFNLKTKMPTDNTIQGGIVTILANLNSKIKLNNHINTLMEEIAKTIYDYWFVQFDFPDEKGKPYKSSGGKMVWNEDLKREIPEGWEIAKMEECSEIKKGDLITSKDAEIGSIKVVAAGIDFSYFHSTPNRMKNTITISGSGANAGYINFWREPIFASDCITVRGKSDSETLILLQYLKFIQPHILNQASGSAQPHVYPSDIKALNYMKPPEILIRQYGELMIPINDKIAENLNENIILTKLRDWLLPMLMNGQVKVN